MNVAKGGDIGQNVLQAGINTAVSVASYAVASEIGTWYRAGDIDGVLHKVLHAGSGFLQGMASNLDDPIRGGVGGTFAALAEVVYEALPAGSFSPEARANIAIMSAATAAFFTKQDVNAAALTATNAVYHNAQGGDKGKEEVVKIEEGRGEFRGLIEDPDRKIMEPLGIVSDLADIDLPGFKNVRDGAHVVWDTVSGKVQLIPNLEEYKNAFKNMPSRYRVAFLPLDCIVHSKEIGHHIIDFTPTKGYEVPLMFSGVGIGGKALQPIGREAGPLFKPYVQSALNVWKREISTSANVGGRTFLLEAPKSLSSIPTQIPQVRLNYAAGRWFQNEVHAFLMLPENRTPYKVLLPGRGQVSTIPDLSLVSAGITDIKNVKYITFTKQLQAQAALAVKEKTSFNLIISPGSERMAKKVWDAINVTNGKIFEFDPVTQKMIERIVEGNTVLR